MKVFCGYENADVVGIVVAGDGDTLPLYVIIKLFVLPSGGDPKS